MSWRFFTMFFVLLLALFFEVSLQGAFDLSLGFVLATLVAAAYFLSFIEIAVAVLFAALALNWQPAFSPEILVFSLIPILVYFLRAFMPLHPFLGSLLFISAAAVLFYLILSPRFLIIHPGIFILDLFASLVYGSITFFALRYAVQT